MTDRKPITSPDSTPVTGPDANRKQAAPNATMPFETDVPAAITPGEVRYIKLGTGGGWARQSFENGRLSFGYHSIPDHVAVEEDWDEVARLLAHRSTAGSITSGVNEVAQFYGMGRDCLWITFAEGHLWWAFADQKVVWIDDDTDSPSRYRKVIGD